MGAAAHLGIRTGEYDARIRTFIPFYEEILDAAASALATVLPASRPLVVDLGIGSGALAAECLAELPRGTRLIGIDSDGAMLAMARRRLGRRVETIEGNFLQTPVPRSDAVTASFALHHVRTAAEKGRLYRRLFRSLRPGGVFVNADCCLASNLRARSADRAQWRRDLARRYGPARAEQFLRAWAQEDVYLPLELEVALLRRAGFVVDVAWRRASFAVIVGTKVAR